MPLRVPVSGRGGGGANALSIRITRRWAGWTRFIKEVFFAAIERESNGRLKIEDHWEGELSRSYDALRTVGKGGAVDMAAVVPEYTAARAAAVHQIFKSLPDWTRGDRQVASAAWMRKYRNRRGTGEGGAVAILFATEISRGFFGTVDGPWKTSGVAAVRQLGTAIFS